MTKDNGLSDVSESPVSEAQKFQKFQNPSNFANSPSCHIIISGVIFLSHPCCRFLRVYPSFPLSSLPNCHTRQRQHTSSPHLHPFTSALSTRLFPTLSMIIFPIVLPCLALLGVACTQSSRLLFCLGVPLCIRSSQFYLRSSWPSTDFNPFAIMFVNYSEPPSSSFLPLHTTAPLPLRLSSVSLACRLSTAAFATRTSLFCTTSALRIAYRHYTTTSLHHNTHKVSRSETCWEGCTVMNADLLLEFTALLFLLKLAEFHQVAA
jgi:hypothetical protein